MSITKYLKTALVFGVLLGWLYYEYGFDKINDSYLGEAITVPIIWVLGSITLLVLITRNKEKTKHFSFILDLGLVVGSTIYLLIFSPVSFLILAWVIPALFFVFGLIRFFVLKNKVTGIE